MISRDFRERAGRALAFVPWQRWLPWLLVLLPPLGLGLLIRDHQVNIRFLDDWMFVSMLGKAREGTLTMHDLFQVQMEHRLAFVRLIILICDKFSPLDVRPQFWISWVLLLGTGFNVLWLMRRTFGEIRHWWVGMVLCSMILFTPLQYMVVLWAMMFQVACPAFFFTSAMVVLLSDRLPAWARFLLAVLCAECGTLSFASGLQAWVFLIPLILWAAPFSSEKSRRIFLGAWIVVFAVTVGLYFHDLKNAADPAYSYGAGEEEVMQKHLGGFLSDPARGLRFVLGFLGSHLARGTSASLYKFAQFLGGVSLLAYLSFCVTWLLNFKNVTLRRRWLPWILLGSYSVGTAALTAMGRAWATKFGESAVSSRYVIQAVPLTVALIALFILAAEEWSKRRPQSRMRVQLGQSIAATALLMLLLNGWIHGARLMEVWESSRLRAATSTLFSKVLFTEGNVVLNAGHAQDADDLGLLHPPMLKNTRLDNFRVERDLLAAASARLEKVAEIEGKLVATGTAALRGRSRVADGVFLCYRDDQNNWIIFHVTHVQQMPLYMFDTLDRDLRFTHTPDSSKILSKALAHFSGTCPINRVPPGRREMRAWIFDYKKQSAYPIEGRFIINSETKLVEQMDKPEPSGKKKAE
jgi:hypothetical protein